jgi:hypothetical protein
VLCVYHIIPTYGSSDRVVFGCIGLHLLVVLVLQVLGTWRSLVSFRLKKEAYAEQRAEHVISSGVQFVAPNFTPFKWTLPANGIALASLVVETVQLAMFSLKALESPTTTTTTTSTTSSGSTSAAQTESSDVSGAQKFANYVFLSFSQFVTAHVHRVTATRSSELEHRTILCIKGSLALTRMTL